MSRAPVTLLAEILVACASEEGGRRALARALGVSPQTLHELLRGRAPGKHVARLLADFLSVTHEEVQAWAAECDRLTQDLDVNAECPTPPACRRRQHAGLPRASSSSRRERRREQPPRSALLDVKRFIDREIEAGSTDVEPGRRRALLVAAQRLGRALADGDASPLGAP